MYSVMAIFKSSIVWGLFEYNEYTAQRISDHPVFLIEQTSGPQLVCRKLTLPHSYSSMIMI
jgi:hypothetical protein